jgi:hypothetical protein
MTDNDKIAELARKWVAVVREFNDARVLHEVSGLEYEQRLARGERFYRLLADMHATEMALQEACR